MCTVVINHHAIFHSIQECNVKETLPYTHIFCFCRIRQAKVQILPERILPDPLCALQFLPRLHTHAPQTKHSQTTPPQDRCSQIYRQVTDVNDFPHHSLLFLLKASFRLSAQDFCANPIEIRSCLDSLNGKKRHEIRFLQIRFKLRTVNVLESQLFSFFIVLPLQNILTFKMLSHPCKS